MMSLILASTSSLDKLFLQSVELIIAMTVQRSGVNWDEQIRHFHGGEHQLGTTTTQAQYFKSEYKYIRRSLENQHPYATGFSSLRIIQIHSSIVREKFDNDVQGPGPARGGANKSTT
jgi:hypothetical protein